MSTIHLICCTREDESKYWHKCACPSAKLVTKSLEKDATLCGFSEFEGDGIVASSPPKKYRVKVSLFLNIFSPRSRFYKQKGDWSDFDSDGCRTREHCAEVALYQDGYQTGSRQTFSRNAQTCEVEDTVFEDLTTTGTVYPAPALCGKSSSLSESDFCVSTTTGSMTPIVTSPTNKSSNLLNEYDCDSSDLEIGTEDSCDPSTPETVVLEHSWYTQTTSQDDLSDEDTESDALNRADEVEGDSDESIHEERTANTTSFNFTKRTVDYAIIFTSLVPGLSYDWVLPVDSGTAEADVAVNYAPDTPDSGTFTATKVYHIEGGTLNVSSQEFIDNAFSLDPLDYGLGADAEVVTPTEILDHALGMAYKLGAPTVEKTP